MRGLTPAHTFCNDLAITWIAAHSRCWPIRPDTAQSDSVAQSAAACSPELDWLNSEESVPIQGRQDSSLECSAADSQWNWPAALFPAVVHKARSLEPAPEPVLSVAYCRAFPEPVSFGE